MTNLDLDQKAQQEAYEEQNVHEVYQQIAQHFSSTRYKVRPYDLSASASVGAHGC